MQRQSLNATLSGLVGLCSDSLWGESGRLFLVFACGGGVRAQPRRPEHPCVGSEGLHKKTELFFLSGGIRRDKLNGTNGAVFFFADFRRFLLIFTFFLEIIALWRCRFSQETAEFCRNPFVPFSLFLLIPPCF